jgi:hypothetical protein
MIKNEAAYQGPTLADTKDPRIRKRKLEERCANTRQQIDELWDRVYIMESEISIIETGVFQ